MAYVLALAARAGYTTSQHDLDRIGTDVDVHSEEQMQPAFAVVATESYKASTPYSGWQ